MMEESYSLQVSGSPRSAESLLETTSTSKAHESKRRLPTALQDKQPPNTTEFLRAHVINTLITYYLHHYNSWED